MLVRWAHRATAVAAMSVVNGGWAGDRILARQAAVKAAYPEAMFSGLRWRSLGPDRGGRSIAVAGSAARPLEFYFGATGGGVWKTADGGTTWVAAADRFLRTSSVGAVAVAESSPDWRPTITAGTPEATQMRFSPAFCTTSKFCSLKLFPTTVASAPAPRNMVLNAFVAPA